MTAPNIVNVATITGKTSPQLVGTTATAIVSNAAGSGKVIEVKSIIVGNTDASSNYNVTVDFYRGTTAYRFGPSIAIPAGAGLDVVSNVITLEEGDSIRLTASAASKLEAIASYKEIS